MPTKRHSTEQVVSKLRQAEVEPWPAGSADVQEDRIQRADVLPVAEGVRWLVEADGRF